MIEVRVFAFVCDAEGRVLCVRRAHEPRDWTLPGGKMDEGESPSDTLVREVEEESGYRVQPSELIGIYSTPAENDLALLFRADIRSRGDWKPDHEIARAEFHDPHALPAPFSEHASVRISDALGSARGVVRLLEKKRS